MADDALTNFEAQYKSVKPRLLLLKEELADMTKLFVENAKLQEIEDIKASTTIPDNERGFYTTFFNATKPLTEVELLVLKFLWSGFMLAMCDAADQEIVTAALAEIMTESK